MFTVMREVSFMASHALKEMPEGHEEERSHSHLYRVIVYLQSETLNTRGRVVDDSDLELLQQLIHSSFDRRNLNDVLEAQQPTTEKIAQFIYVTCHLLYASGWGKLVCEVRVSEDEEIWASYMPTRYSTIQNNFYGQVYATGENPT